MKFLTEDQAQERLNHPDNVFKVVHHSTKPVGRTKGSKNLSPESRELVGTLGNLMTAKEVSEITGVSPMAVHLNSNGMHKSNGEIDKELKEKVQGKNNEIKDKALEILMDSMGLITHDEIANAKLSEKVMVSERMASIVEKVSPKSVIGDGAQIHFHIHGPELKSEEDFESIDVVSREVK